MKRNWLLLLVLPLSSISSSLWSNTIAGGPCDPPFLLAVSNITTTTATLNWTPLGMESEWEVAVVPQGSPTPSLPTLSGVLSHPVVHPGLNPATDYDFYVRAVCDSMPGPWAKYNSHFLTGLTNPSGCKLGLRVPDEQCLDFQIWVGNAAGTAMGTDVYLLAVRLTMRHTWDDDVDMSLMSPDGVWVDLSSDNGGNEENYGTPSDPNCQNVTVFVSELAPGACDLPSIQVGEAPFLGQYLPEQPLTWFNTGANPNAIWTLRVCDDAEDDIGRLEFVELVFAPLVCRAPAGVTVISVDSTFANLDWFPGDSCTGTFIEYGPPGFTPGTDENPGPGGTVVAAACPPYQLIGLLPETTFDIYIREACPGGGFSNNSCPISLSTLCSPAPATQWEGFNNEIVCEGICSTPCDLSGIWANSRADGLDWLAHAGETETPGTGPSDDFPGGGNYVYLEGSGACDFNSEAILYSHCMEIVAPPGSSCHFSFDYHMFGTAVNSLQLDISEDGGQTWTNLWQLSGNQGEQWYRQFIDLSGYHGLIAQLRFVGKKGNNVRSDIGLDNLTFFGSFDFGQPPFVYFQDLDLDGYGNDEIFFATCEPIAPAGYAALGGDCFDLSEQISPGLPETPCDGFDINCNGMVDEWVLPTPVTTHDTICSGAFGLVEAEPAFGGTIVWYDAPTGGNPLDTGFFYLPIPPPEQSGNLPVTYEYYAEEINIQGCTTAVRGIASITVLPRPDIFIPPGQFEPICAGDTVDLSTLIIQDLSNSFGMLTYHSSFPPTPGNQIDPPSVHPLFSTEYYIMSTAEGGCTDVDSVTVLIKDSPIAEIIGDSELCKGASEILQVVDQGNGIPPLDYVWSNASNATSIFILGNGQVGTINTYSVTITDAGGCRSSDSFDVEITGNINSVLVSEQDVSSCDGSNGAINLIVNGGNTPFSIAWQGPSSGTASSGSFSYTITGLSQGAYTLTVTDNSADPCPFIIPLAIVNGPQAQITLTSVEPVSCYEQMDGCIELEVSGANPQIVWSTGATNTNSICGLDGGSYSVTVTDGACENVLSGIIVQEPDSLSGKIAFLKNVSCFGAEDGEILVVVGGGTAPYQYLWSNSDITPNLLQVGAGEYTLTVTDARGCQLVLGPNEITQPDAILWTMLETPVPCTDGVGGSLEVLVSGGVEPYGYEWSTGSNLPQIENLGPGIYDLTITDLHGCTVETSGLVENPPALQVQVSLLLPPSCFGMANGQIGLNAFGGTPPYTFAWSSGDTGPLVALPDGVYDVTATDSKGCIFVLSGIALVAPNPVSVFNFITPESCLGKEDGQIQLVPQSGQLPFSYEWEDGSTGAVRQNLASGEYSCTITDANGCERVLVIQVGYNQPISANVTPLGPNCANGANGKIFLTPMGGAPFYSYQWNSGQTTKDLLNVPAGSYVSTITDMNGCKLIIDTVELLNPPPIVIELLALDSISCFGVEDGGIDMGVSGGVPPYLYTWNTQETSEDLDQIGGGIYVLTVEDSLSCAFSGVPVVLPEPSLLVLEAEAIDVNINCQSNSLDTLFVQIMGGSAPYHILWNNGQQDPFVLGSPPGDYSVTVTDAQGCVDSLTSLKVPEPVPYMTLTVNTDFSFSGDCQDPGGSASLKVIIHGGQATFQYNWSVGIQGSTNLQNFSLNNLLEDTYSVTVTDATGCVATTNPVVVNFPNPLNAVVTGSSIGDVYCKFGNDGFIHPIVNGGAPPYQFVWMNENGETVGISQNLDSIPAGSYTLQVVDQNECLITIADIEITEPQNALEVSLDVDHLVCYGDNQGAITVFPTGGSPLYSYSWNIPGNGSFQDELPAGFYFLTVEDSEGCLVSIDSIEVIQPDLPLALDEVEISPILCNGEKTGAINIEMGGGTEPYDYIWSNGKLTEDISGLAPGSYKCTVVDANGCQFVTQLFSLSEPDDLQLAEVEVDSATIGLADGSLSVLIEGGVMPYSYAWSNGDTSSMPDSLFSDNYFLTVTDANGCVLELQIFLPFLLLDGTKDILPGSLRIYPNPAKDIIWVETGGIDLREHSIEVWDLLGQSVRTFQPADEDTSPLSLSLGGLPPGMYIIRVRSGTEVIGEGVLVVHQ